MEKAADFRVGGTFDELANGGLGQVLILNRHKIRSHRRLVDEARARAERDYDSHRSVSRLPSLIADWVKSGR